MGAQLGAEPQEHTEGPWEDATGETEEAAGVGQRWSNEEKWANYLRGL